MHGVPERDGAFGQVRSTRLRSFVVLFTVVVNLLLADAVVKELAVAKLKGAAAVPVLSGLFNLAYVENRGCAWGLFQGQVWPLAIFGVLAFAFLVWKRRSVFFDDAQLRVFGFRLGPLAEPLLYAGILGNVLDRLVRGYVVDMFDFYWGVHHFPCFNLADTYISVAAALLVLGAFGRRKRA